MRIKIDDKIYRLKEIESGVDSLMELVEEPKFKDGDFLHSDWGDENITIICRKINGNDIYYHVSKSNCLGLNFDKDRFWPNHVDFRLATESEKKELIDALAEVGKRWNADKKCIEDIPKRKFKAGDKVRIKEGVSSKTHRYVSPNFTEPMDEFIGKELTVKEYSSSGFVVFFGDYFEFHFHENWLEPWSDEPKVGDMVIAWNNDMSLAVIGIKIDANPAPACKHVLNNNNSYKHAIKFDGTKEHLEKIRKG